MSVSKGLSKASSLDTPNSDSSFLRSSIINQDSIKTIWARSACNYCTCCMETRALAKLPALHWAIDSSRHFFWQRLTFSLCLHMVSTQLEVSVGHGLSWGSSEKERNVPETLKLELDCVNPSNEDLVDHFNDCMLLPRSSSSLALATRLLQLFQKMSHRSNSCRLPLLCSSLRSGENDLLVFPCVLK